MSSHSEAGKGSGRRPKGLVTDEKLQDNWDRIFKNKANSKPSEDMFLFKEKEKWREDEIQADEEKHLGTLRCRWCKFKQQKPDSVLCESCGKEVTV
jgi:hypothetical protein|tara:strand:- start:5957 stop:6244 length:288 start_codon:yes stop_codon:yes gene_type:complete